MKIPFGWSNQLTSFHCIRINSGRTKSTVSGAILISICISIMHLYSAFYIHVQCSKIHECSLHQFNTQTQVGIIKVLLETFSRIKNRFHSENVTKFYTNPIIGFLFFSLWCRVHILFHTMNHVLNWLSKCSWFIVNFILYTYVYRLCPTGNANFICQRIIVSLFNEFKCRIFTVECNWRNYSSVELDTHSFSFKRPHYK